MARLTDEERLALLANNPPTVVVDWDGTCVPSEWPGRPMKWLPGAPEAIRAFLDAGLDVRIHSTRLHKYEGDYTTLNQSREDDYRYIRRMLDHAGLYDVDVIFDDSKPGAIAYVDDKAIRFTGDNWPEIQAQILTPKHDEERKLFEGVGGVTDFIRTNIARPGDIKPTNPKDAVGSSKLPIHLWPETATIMGTMGLLEGMLKYGRSNWREAGVRASIYVDALRRHIGAWFEGEDNAPDSGLPHLAHALACLAILVDAEAAGQLYDDRQYAGGGYRDLVEECTPHVERLKKKYADKTPKHWTIKDTEAA